MALDRQEKQTLRLVLAYKITSLVIFCMGVLWSIFSLSSGQWLLALADGTMVLIALVSWLLIRFGKLSAALILSEYTFLAFAIAFCLLFDTPTATAPRVSHLYLLVLAALGYINYLRRGSWVQLLLIALCLGAFVTFSSQMLVFPFAHPVPDAFRGPGTWINAIVATALLCGCMYVMKLELSKSNGLARELKSALWNEEFELFYQKQVDGDGRIIGAEALLRWRHPGRGYVSPGEFIPVAEEAGMMPQLGSWVIADACKTLSRWRDDPALGHLTVSVNVSADQFLVSDFERLVLGTLAFHGVPPAKLKLELTESVVATDIETVVARMNALRAAGITISLDDFGTGYSSLSYLRRLPLQQLKIDRSFVQEALTSTRGSSLVKSIIQLGQDLGLRILAEGVETEEQFRFLREMGCQEFQGFLFGRPVARPQFEKDNALHLS